jgi:HEPN domain-containing protein
MEQYETWLLIAQDDLKAANILLESDVTNAALFHVQQGIEKCLKAYLSFKKTGNYKNT